MRPNARAASGAFSAISACWPSSHEGGSAVIVERLSVWGRSGPPIRAGRPRQPGHEPSAHRHAGPDLLDFQRDLASTHLSCRVARTPAYAPALFRFFLAAVGDRHQAEDLTGTAFVSAIDSLPRFRGPVEALGGWLFGIARHDLYDHRRKQSPSRIEPLEDNLGEAAAAASALGVLDRESGTETASGATSSPTRPWTGCHCGSGRSWGGWPRDGPTGASPKRASSCCTPSAPTCRTSWSSWTRTPKLEAVAFVLEHGQTSDSQGLDPPAMRHLEGTQLVAALQHLSPTNARCCCSVWSPGSPPPKWRPLGKTVGDIKALRHRGLAALAGVLDFRSSY
jgi:Sigma-70 region 2